MAGGSPHTALTIGRGIRCAAAANPDKIALDDSAGNSRTYGELVANMNAAGGIAEQFGLAKGDVAALITPNCIEYPEIVAGLSERGIIVATLNPGLAVSEFDRIFSDCRPSAVIAARDIELPETAARTVRLGEEWDALSASAPTPSAAHEIDEREAFALAYTSGTTGKPKGVLLSHRSRCLLFSAMAAEYGCFGRDDHFLALAPMCHGAGLAFALAPLYHGGRCTLLYSTRPEAILAAIDEYRPSGIFVVPTHLQRLFAAPDEVRERYRGKHALRTIISNAAALAPALKHEAVAYFGEGVLHETYGSTEGGIVTNIRPEQLLAKPRSVGGPFLGMEVELRTQDGSLARVGEPGELFCRSPYSFNGYLNRPEETARTVIDDWVTVGDLAIRDEDGAVTITDRKKDMIVTGGMNVYPREIEMVLEQADGVRECAVIGEPSAEWGEALHAFIIAERDAAPSPEALIETCREHLAAYKVPKKVTFLDALPRSATGKLMKRDLRALAAGADS